MVSTAGTTSHHNDVRLFFFDSFSSILPCFLGSPIGATHFWAVCAWKGKREKKTGLQSFCQWTAERLLKKKKKKTVAATITVYSVRNGHLQSSNRISPTSNPTVDTMQQLQPSGNVGTENTSIFLLKAINARPFDWNKCWCAARAVSRCWVAHLSKSVLAWSDLRANGSMSDSLWVSAGPRMMGACSELRVCVY